MRRLSARRRRTARGGTYALVVAALVLISLGLFALLRPASGPSEDEGEREDEPARESAVQETTEEAAARGVVVRVSGTEGTSYQGTYGTPEEVQTVEGTIGAGPTDYEVNVEGVEESALTAVFRKPRIDDEGTLRVQILDNGQVVAEGETIEEFGEVNINWPSQQEPAELGVFLLMPLLVLNRSLVLLRFRFWTDVARSVPA